MQSLIKDGNRFLRHGAVMPPGILLQTSVQFLRQILDYQCRHIQCFLYASKILAYAGCVNAQKKTDAVIACKQTCSGKLEMIQDCLATSPVRLATSQQAIKAMSMVVMSKMAQLVHDYILDAMSRRLDKVGVQRNAA